MQAETTLNLTGSWPDNLQVGDVVRVEGPLTMTVHTIRAEMIDTSDFSGKRTYLPSVIEVGAYANDVKFVAAREP